MELLQLKYFKTVAEIGKISEAAQTLFISAPALSTSIARLENELGVKLFDRTNNRIILNRQGKILLYSLALPLETLVVPLIANDMFGLASYDRTLGILLCMNYTGYALGAPAFNLCFDRLGSYVPILYLCCGIMVAIFVLFQFILRSSANEKARILSEQTAS